MEIISTPIVSAAPSGTPFEVEWHCLDMRYQHLRQRSPQTQRRLMLSICTYGLLVPITVIAAAEAVSTVPRWTVIDGYMRAQATRTLGKDTIAAQTCGLPADEALLTLYRTHQSRPWEPLEEATLLQELMTHYQYTQAQLAVRFGKSETWVCHRLQLITELPEFVAAAVYQGTVSHWSASRVLIPFARANAHHAKKMIDYLATHRHSSREIQTFYEHYMQSRPKVREQMIAQPALFFKVKAASAVKSAALSRDEFPEQIWEQRLMRVIQELNALTVLLPRVFYPEQTPGEREYLEQRLHQAVAAMASLQQSLRRIPHAQTSYGANGTTASSSRPEPARDQPLIEAIAQ